MCPIFSDDVTPTRVDIDQVRHRLGLSEKTAAWLRSIPRPPGAAEPTLPDDAEAAERLHRLGIPDATDTLAARPTPAGNPELWWVLDRVYQHMIATMGDPAPREGFFGWPAVSDRRDPVSRHLYVWLFLAVLPRVRRYHAEHHVPDDVSWASLGCLGSSMASDMRLTGQSGLDRVWSPPLAFRGALYSLGRLAFERIAAAPEGADFPPLPPGTCAIGTHIPGGTPLDPQACDESFALARTFLTDNFADQPAAFLCHSWLLDPQVAEYLPAESNIVRFQRRFTLAPNQHEPSHNEILEYVFKRRNHGPEVPDDVLAELPQDTALQRAYVTHLQSGRRWYARTGWIPLPGEE
ncbi:MAG TPA: acyltransferase domain-containing protein [Mycobacteriales bacterium]|nr:acyltransferase domain-containing protein [Mycobacteriales bacterium]